MCSIEAILEINEHPNADKLEIVTIMGYQAIVPKDKYDVGDLVIYIQPDHVLPPEGDEPINKWADPYRKYVSTRVKAIKLRGSWSEGLVVDFISNPLFYDFPLFELQPGLDVSKSLGVTHYEPPPPPQHLLDQGIKNVLPYSIPKTDESRWENINKKLENEFGKEVDVTLKIDGQSWSAYYSVEDDKFGVLGRKLEFPTDIDNYYTRHIERYDIESKLKKFCIENNVSLCIRGESYGEGIQNFKHNPYSKKTNGVAIFSVYNIDEREYARKGSKYYFVNVCKELDIPHVPLVEENIVLTKDIIEKYSKGIEKLNGERFEGVVIQTPSRSFKVINKKYDSMK